MKKLEGEIGRLKYYGWSYQVAEGIYRSGLQKEGLGWR